MFVPWFAPFTWWWFVAAAMMDKAAGGDFAKIADDIMRDDVRRRLSPDRKGVKADPY